MDFQLILLHQSRFRQELANVFALISLQLQDLTILRMFDYRSVASKFLRESKRKINLKDVSCPSQSAFTDLFTCSDYFLQVVVR